MRATGERGEAGATERERDAGAAPRELLGARRRRGAPGSCGFFGSGSSSTPVSFLRPSSERGLGQAERLRRLHQVPRHRLFVVVLASRSGASAASRTRRASGGCPENSGLSWKMSMALLLRCALAARTRPSRSSPCSASKARASRISFSTGIVVDEAVAAEDLDGIDRRAGDGVAGEHARAAREIVRARQALVDRPRGVQREQARRGARGGHRVVAQPDQRLELADRLAELDALVRVLRRRAPSRRWRRRRRARRATRAPR